MNVFVYISKTVIGNRIYRALILTLIIVIIFVLFFHRPDAFEDKPEVDLMSGIPEQLQRAINETEAERIYELLKTLDQVARLNDIPCFMTWGTLLGSYRHHGLIPWDDDGDVFMPYEKKELIVSAFNSYVYPRSSSGEMPRQRSATLGDYVAQSIHLPTVYHFYPRSATHIFPFIDIFLYSENSTHIWWDLFEKRYIYRRDVIFPLHRRPLGKITMNSPHDGASILHDTYGSSAFKTCKSIPIKHRDGARQDVTEMLCSALAKIYPFVRHRMVPNEPAVVMETLLIGDKNLNTYSVFFERRTQAYQQLLIG